MTFISEPCSLRDLTWGRGKRSGRSDIAFIRKIVEPILTWCLPMKRRLMWVNSCEACFSRWRTAWENISLLPSLLLANVVLQSYRPFRVHKTTYMISYSDSLSSMKIRSTLVVSFSPVTFPAHRVWEKTTGLNLNVWLSFAILPWWRLGPCCNDFLEKDSNYWLKK